MAEASRRPMPITKPEVQGMAQREAKIQPYQDDKLEMYQKNHKDMDNIFQKAREVRAHLQDGSDARNKEVLDKLQNIRARVDNCTRQHHNRLREFSSQFDKNLADGKRHWRAQLHEIQEKNQPASRRKQCGNV